MKFYNTELGSPKRAEALAVTLYKIVRDLDYGLKSLASAIAHDCFSTPAAADQARRKEWAIAYAAWSQATCHDSSITLTLADAASRYGVLDCAVWPYFVAKSIMTEAAHA